MSIRHHISTVFIWCLKNVEKMLKRISKMIIPSGHLGCWTFDVKIFLMLKFLCQIGVDTSTSTLIQQQHFNVFYLVSKKHWKSVEKSDLTSKFQIARWVALVQIEVIPLIDYPPPWRKNKSLHFLWMALTTCVISSVCAGWGKYSNESEWKLERVRIMLQTPLLLVPLENVNNLQFQFISFREGISKLNLPVCVLLNFLPSAFMLLLPLTNCVCVYWRTVAGCCASFECFRVRVSSRDTSRCWILDHHIATWRSAKNHLKKWFLPDHTHSRSTSNWLLRVVLCYGVVELDPKFL